MSDQTNAYGYTRPEITTGSFGLLSEDDDLAHYGDELRDAREYEVKK